MKYISLMLAISILSGCSSFTSPARKHELDGKNSYWMDYDVTRRGTIVSKSDSPWKSCAEPAPDAAIGVVAKLGGKLDIASKGGAEGNAELTQDIVNLAEKTQMVMFLRESLFRLCELSLNSSMDSANAEALYKKVIDAAIQLVEAEKFSAETELQKARLESANQAQFIYQDLSAKGVAPEIIEELLKNL